MVTSYEKEQCIRPVPESGLHRKQSSITDWLKHQVQTKNTQRLQALDYHKMTLATVGRRNTLAVNVEWWNWQTQLVGAAPERGTGGIEGSTPSSTTIFAVMAKRALVRRRLGLCR